MHASEGGIRESIGDTYHATNLGAWAWINREEETSASKFFVEVNPSYSWLNNNVHVFFVKLHNSIHMQEINTVDVRIMPVRYLGNSGTNLMPPCGAEKLPSRLLPPE